MSKHIHVFVKFINQYNRVQKKTRIIKSNITKLYAENALVSWYIWWLFADCIGKEFYRISKQLFFSSSFCIHAHTHKHTLHMNSGKRGKKTKRILFFYLQWCGSCRLIHWWMIFFFLSFFCNCFQLRMLFALKHWSFKMLF